MFVYEYEEKTKAVGLSSLLSVYKMKITLLSDYRHQNRSFKRHDLRQFICERWPFAATFIPPISQHTIYVLRATDRLPRVSTDWWFPHENMHLMQISTHFYINSIEKKCRCTSFFTVTVVIVILIRKLFNADVGWNASVNDGWWQGNECTAGSCCVCWEMVDTNYECGLLFLFCIF